MCIRDGGTRNISWSSPRKAHELRCSVFRFTLVLECPGQYPAPQNIKRSFVQLLELGFVHVGESYAAVIRGESDITWGEPVFLSSVITRNSPLWVSNPKQQIAYLALKYWARLYCPAVVLGVYTPDEIEQRTEKEINPTPQRVSLADISGDTVTTTQSAQESSVNVDSLADDFRERIESAQNVDSAKSLRADIETAKATLGSALFTELKNKAVKRYYLVDARNKVEEAIKSLPQPDEPHASERFAEAERMLASSKRHLGDELHDQFSITLADMKPEYVA